MKVLSPKRESQGTGQIFHEPSGDKTGKKAQRRKSRDESGAAHAKSGAAKKTAT